MSEAIVKYEGGLTPEQKNLIKSKISKDASDEEIAFFLELCKQTGLNPFANQIWLVPFYDKEAKRNKYAPIVSIDGLRSLAQNTGEYDGQCAPIWVDENGNEFKIWTSTKNPFACKISVYKKGVKNPTVGIAYFNMYAKELKDRDTGKSYYGGFWATPQKAAHMISKCAEALALRKAFPQKLSYLFIREEMEHNVKQGSKYEQGITVATDDELREYLTDDDVKHSVMRSDNHNLKGYFEQPTLDVKDEYTGKKIVKQTRAILTEESKELDELVQDLLVTKKRFAIYLTDAELELFKTKYNAGQVSRKALLSTFDEIIKRENRSLGVNIDER